jgi:hypothetical protein
MADFRLLDRHLHILLLLSLLWPIAFSVVP